MDCSRTEVFLAELKRMCANVGGCYKCKIYKLLEPHKPCIGGGGAFAKEPEKCIEIVQEWSDANQPKTRLSLLKEAFPNAKYCEDEQPEACAGDLFGISCPIYEKEYIADNECMKCWNTPIEGVQ